MEAVVLLLVLVPVQGLHGETSAGGLRHLRVVVEEGARPDTCREVVAGVVAAVEAASRHLHLHLGGRAVVERVEVQVPSAWGDQDCGQALQPSYDIGVGVKHTQSYTFSPHTC